MWSDFVFSLKTFDRRIMIPTLFHELPKTTEEADEFFKRYHENFLTRNSLQCLEKAKNVSDIIATGIKNLKSEVHSKDLMLKVRTFKHRNTAFDNMQLLYYTYIYYVLIIA